MSMQGHRHLITLQRPVHTVGELGDRVVAWVDVIRTWARRSYRLRDAAEAIAGGAVIHTQLVQFDIRRRPIGTDWRLLAVEHGQPVIYDIRSLAETNDGREMAILAVAGARSD